MYKKVIVLELHEAYALAMEEGGTVLRIKKKEGLSVGDTVYVLPEDLYCKKKPSAALAWAGAGCVRNSPAYQKSKWMRVAGLAAMLALCVFLLVPQATPIAYALASFDGDASVQVELDEEYHIIKASSPDGSVPAEALNSLVGKGIEESGPTLRELCGSGSVLLGYTFMNDNDEDLFLDKELRVLFEGQPVVCLAGNFVDFQTADGQMLSLGSYLLEKHMIEDDLDDILECLSAGELEQMLKSNPYWLKNPDFREVLEDRRQAICEAKEEAAELAETDEEDDDIEEEDDFEDSSEQAEDFEEETEEACIESDSDSEKEELEDLEEELLEEEKFEDLQEEPENEWEDWDEIDF